MFITGLVVEVCGNLVYQLNFIRVNYPYRSGQGIRHSTSLMVLKFCGQIYYIARRSTMLLLCIYHYHKSNFRSHAILFTEVVKKVLSPNPRRKKLSNPQKLPSYCFTIPDVSHSYNSYTACCITIAPQENVMRATPNKWCAMKQLSGLGESHGEIGMVERHLVAS